jgi:digeranylgeranylglycerophospholipid reductase
MSQNQDFDVLVVGASFAGSTIAQMAAKQGARVLLLEKNSAVGRVIHTTGVLIAEVLELTRIPRSTLLDPVNTFHIYPPNRRRITVSTSGFRYWMSNTAGLLRSLVGAATAAGAVLQTGARFTDARPNADGVTVLYQANGAEHRARGRFLIGADGPLSRVAEVSHLHRNHRFLAGAEWIVDGALPPDHTFSLIFDRSLAPGYCAWLAPRGENAVLGVAGYARRFDPAQALRQAANEFSQLHGDSALRPVEHKGGIIPIDGPLGKMYNERVLLVGDAASLCGAATGGGIFQAIASAQLAADHVIKYLNGDNRALQTYRRTLHQFYNLRSYFFLERQVRRLLDELPSNSALQWMFDRFRQPSRQQLLKRGLLETPVSDMERVLWELLVKGLLHPLPSREAVSGALWLGWQGMGRLLSRAFNRAR